MKRIAFFLPVIFYSLAQLSCSCGSTKNTVPLTDSIYGTWKYVDCTYKNTWINGRITFNPDGTFVLEATARDDYPVGPIAGTYHYQVSGSQLTTDYAKGYGLSPYFLVDGNSLYFSDSPLRKTDVGISDDGLLQSWRYRLTR